MSINFRDHVRKCAELGVEYLKKEGDVRSRDMIQVYVAQKIYKNEMGIKVSTPSAMIMAMLEIGGEGGHVERVERGKYLWIQHPVDVETPPETQDLFHEREEVRGFVIAIRRAKIGLDKFYIELEKSILFLKKLNDHAEVAIKAMEIQEERRGKS